MEATHFIKGLCDNFSSRIPEGPEERGRYEAATPAGRAEREGERERQTDGGRDGGTERGEGGQEPSERVDSVLITAGTRLVNVYRVEGLTVIN